MPGSTVTALPPAALPIAAPAFRATAASALRSSFTTCTASACMPARVAKVARVALLHLGELLAVDEAFERAAHQPVEPPPRLIELARGRHDHRDPPFRVGERVEVGIDEGQRGGRGHEGLP